MRILRINYKWIWVKIIIITAIMVVIIWNLVGLKDQEVNKVVGMEVNLSLEKAEDQIQRRKYLDVNLLFLILSQSQEQIQG